jgi:hypothetical protein
MTNPLLDYLASDHFDDSVGFILPPAALRLRLRQLPRVRAVAAALRRSEITEAMIRDFAGALAMEFRKGQRLPGDLALAALAVVLEHWPTDFAEEYLCDLSSLHLAEMGTSIRVARECLKARYALPANQVQTARYSSGGGAPSRTLVAEKRNSGSERPRPKVRFIKYAEAV